MSLFTESDREHAVSAMVASTAENNTRLMGTMSGIKRRARARAVVGFGLGLEPPDASIATMRRILHKLFNRSVSNNDLHRHFATPGRKASDRVDQKVLDAWFEKHKDSFEERARALTSQIDKEWKIFTADVTEEAAKIRAATRSRARREHPE